MQSLSSPSEFPNGASPRVIEGEIDRDDRRTRSGERREQICGTALRRPDFAHDARPIALHHLEEPYRFAADLERPELLVIPDRIEGDAHVLDMLRAAGELCGL